MQKGITDAGFTTPSPIQSETIPLILAGRDVIAQAQTGTGKTAAFGLPLMSGLLPSDKTQILVITPTRELALQVSQELRTLGKHAGAKVASVYGGASARDQIQSLKNGANIVSGTPGRLLDLMSSRRMKIEPGAVVLDEADRMLDMGFLEDIEQIFEMLPAERQTLLFSATLPDRIQKLAQNILNNPARVRTQSVETAARIKEKYYVVSDHEREPALIRLIESDPPDRAIVFCKTKREADELAGRLSARGSMSRAIHGDLEQSKREQVLRAFRAGTTRVLVATDVAARGLDIQGVSHVFNYHIPFDAESYVHRIGRTGRAGSEGVASTLVAPNEMRTWRRMIRENGGKCELSQIPTSSDIKNKRSDDLILRVKDTHGDAANGRILEKLTEQFELKDVALRLLTMLQQQTTVEGPDKIGKAMADVAELGRDDFKSKKKFGGRKGPRGGSGGGGHGYAPRSHSAGSGGNRSGGGSSGGRSGGGASRSGGSGGGAGGFSKHKKKAKKAHAG
ncbi:MAG: DEAD/DEAH box helicase [Spirochaetia bacterium]|nr:DEAD/DEAH box helicase [Spirochaetia bacterium]